jgi:hypothetical protein
MREKARAGWATWRNGWTFMAYTRERRSATASSSTIVAYAGSENRKPVNMGALPALREFIIHSHPQRQSIGY